MSAPKTTHKELSAEERAKLTTEALYAYYAKTSHLGDLAFFLRHAKLTGPLRAEALSLQARAPRMAKSAVQKEYRALVDRYYRGVREAEYAATRRTALTRTA